LRGLIHNGEGREKGGMKKMSKYLIGKERKLYSEKKKRKGANSQEERI